MPLSPHRLARLLDRGRTLLIAMDHGMTLGVIRGLERTPEMVATVLTAGADGVILHKGLAVASAAMLPRHAALIVHLSASTTLGLTAGRKVLVCGVEEALRIGADAVSVHLNVGDPSEPEQLMDVARIRQECDLLGVPLLVMTYPRGPKITDEHSAEAVGHAVRIAVELGADLVKTNFTGDSESFASIAAACPVPLLIAGGAATTTQLINEARQAMDAGGAGLSVGRAVFGSGDAAGLVRRLRAVVYQGDADLARLGT